MFDFDEDVSDKMLKIFKFIEERQEYKKDINEKQNGFIKSAFNAAAGITGDITAVKHVYYRWKRNEAEKKRYDDTLIDCNRQLGLDFDLKRTIQLQELQEQEGSASKVMDAMDGFSQDGIHAEKH